MKILALNFAQTEPKHEIKTKTNIYSSGLMEKDKPDKFISTSIQPSFAGKFETISDGLFEIFRDLSREQKTFLQDFFRNKNTKKTLGKTATKGIDNAIKLDEYRDKLRAMTKLGKNQKRFTSSEVDLIMDYYKDAPEAIDDLLKMKTVDGKNYRFNADDIGNLYLEYKYHPILKYVLKLKTIDGKAWQYGSEITNNEDFINIIEKCNKTKDLKYLKQILSMKTTDGKNYRYDFKDPVYDPYYIRNVIINSSIDNCLKEATEILSLKKLDGEYRFENMFEWDKNIVSMANTKKEYPLDMDKILNLKTIDGEEYRFTDIEMGDYSESFPHHTLAKTSNKYREEFDFIMNEIDTDGNFRMNTSCYDTIWKLAKAKHDHPEEFNKIWNMTVDTDQGTKYLFRPMFEDHSWHDIPMIHAIEALVLNPKRTNELLEDAKRLAIEQTNKNGRFFIRSDKFERLAKNI